MILAAALLSLAQDAEPPLRVWAAGSTEKIQDSHRAALPHQGVYDPEAKTVKLSGVRGEHIPFQLVVTADHVEAGEVWVEVSPLRAGEHVLPTEQIEVFLEHIKPVLQRRDQFGLWPLVAVERGEERPVVIEADLLIA